MKQRRSFTYLLYHLVFFTKGREPYISSRDVPALLSFLKSKAHDLDCYLEEFGAWKEHVHLLVRIRPTLPLSEVYGQLKGFGTYSWRRYYANKPFKWADGTFAMTVDPYNCEPLRPYIRQQPRHHCDKSTIRDWEPDEGNG